MGQAVFLILAVAVVGAIHYYLWRRLVRDTTRTRRSRRIGTGLVIGLTVLVFATFIGSRAFPHDVATILAWPGYLWLAVMFYLVLALAVLEIPTRVGRALSRRAGIRPRVLVAAASVTAMASPPPADLARALAGPLPSPSEHGPSEPRPSEPGPSEQGLPEQGLPEQGLSEQGLSEQGLSEQGLPEQGLPEQGLSEQGLSEQGLSEQGPSEPGVLETRRLFLARAVAITAGLAAVGITASGVGTALGPPGLKRVQIPLAKLPSGADGYRIALVSDIHLGPLNGIEHTRRIVDLINGLDADIVTVVGDLVDGSVAELGVAASPLRDLRTRHGAYFVTGNHEYYSGYEEWIEEVRELGLRPLRNERVGLPAGLDLAGVNDATGGAFGDAPDYDRALRDRDPNRAVVMLAHQPVQAEEAAARGVDLQLSGHTHGGQIVPFNLIVRLAQQPIVSGLGEVHGMPVYVTNGAGFWGPPVRVGAPPDITLVELRTR